MSGSKNRKNDTINIINSVVKSNKKPYFSSEDFGNSIKFIFQYKNSRKSFTIQKSTGHVIGIEYKPNMSKGEQIIGTFNSENRTDVDLIKEKAIELVNLIEEKGKDPRRKEAAITQIELGVMMAVKSLF